MQFIMTRENVLVPVSQIKHIGSPHKREGSYGGFECPVITVDGDRYSILADDANKLVTSIIPALPGYELITSSYEREEEFAFWRTPIIAWRIGCVDGYPGPVTVGDSETCSQPQAILMPNGQVEIQADSSFDNLADWEKHAREQHTKAFVKARRTAEQASAG
jgi:hypothetical protein